MLKEVLEYQEGRKEKLSAFAVNADFNNTANPIKER